MSTLATNAITDAAGGNTATINSYTPTESNMAGRNRIINGDMRIDARNAGAAVTVDGAAPYTLDRWRAQDITDGAFTIQQDSSAPAGFVNSLKFTTTTADGSLAAAQLARVWQAIEGTNVADLGWGTVSAKTVTISFWVRSSLTGTFGGSLLNNADNRAYPFTYAISVADTWEYKTVTIAGDTTGTWATNTSTGVYVIFGLGAGSNSSGTAGAWAGGSELYSATGAVSVIGTLNATWYITGVQLEAGSVATPFERRQYGQELALCQRYLPAYNAESSSNTPYGTSTQGSSTARIWVSFQFPVQTRVAPTGVSISSTAHFIGAGQNTNMSLSAINFQYASRFGAAIFLDGSGGTSQQAISLISQNASGQILFTGCEL